MTDRICGFTSEGERRKIADMFPQLWRVSTGIHIVRKEKYSYCFFRGSNCRLDGWRPLRKFRSAIRHEIPKAESFNRYDGERTRLETDTSAYYWETAERYLCKRRSR